MSFTTLISTELLAAHLSDTASWRVVDCRFRLNDPQAGLSMYRAGHIPGAVYAHLDDDLSCCIVPGKTGRHPLPTAEAFAAKLAGWGITNDTQVVAYDDLGGAIAARLWWMMRWLGHIKIAVLDGGWEAWKMEDRPFASSYETYPMASYTPSPNVELTADVALVESWRSEPQHRVVDARARERYQGLNEPIDPVAGHIPGAVSAPFKENLDENGFFLDRDVLRNRFESVLNEVPPQQAICYCGSGVTAAHNLLAMAHAGLDGARMYPGSWSEWITDTSRPIATEGD